MNIIIPLGGDVEIDHMRDIGDVHAPGSQGSAHLVVYKIKGACVMAHEDIWRGMFSDAPMFSHAPQRIILMVAISLYLLLSCQVNSKPFPSAYHDGGDSEFETCHCFVSKSLREVSVQEAD